MRHKVFLPQSDASSSPSLWKYISYFHLGCSTMCCGVIDPLRVDGRGPGKFIYTPFIVASLVYSPVSSLSIISDGCYWQCCLLWLLKLSPLRFHSTISVLFFSSSLIFCSLLLFLSVFSYHVLSTSFVFICKLPSLTNPSSPLTTLHLS